MIYPATKDISRKDMKKWVKAFKDIDWKLEKNFFISREIFDKDTINQLNKRLAGENPNNAPSDEERHKTQRDLILKHGIPEEPIILFYNNGKYELWEGWHRTIQLFKLYPEGFKYPNVYIGSQE